MRSPKIAADVDNVALADRLDSLAGTAMRDAMTLGRVARRLFKDGATGHVLCSLRVYADVRNQYGADVVRAMVAEIEQAAPAADRERRKRTAAKRAEYRADLEAHRGQHAGEEWHPGGYQYDSATFWLDRHMEDLQKALVLLKTGHGTPCLALTVTESIDTLQKIHDAVSRLTCATRNKRGAPRRLEAVKAAVEKITAPDASNVIPFRQ